MDGVDLIVPLRAQGWTVLVITGTTDLDRIAEAVAHGAANWVVKGANFPELLATVVEMTNGGGHLPPAERAVLIKRYQEVMGAQRKNAERLKTLSPREREVLSRLTEGATAAAIAAESHTSIRTVQTHIHRILTKLEVSSQLAATVIAVRHRSQPPPIEPSVWRRMRGIRRESTSES
jgi:DNA-binding NarL/FixJ family response regulator